jgi:hypothetical protein
MMTRLQGMSYNLPASKDTVLCRLGGCAACLALHPHAVPSSLRTFYSKRALRSGARPQRISQSSDPNWLCYCRGVTAASGGPCDVRWILDGGIKVVRSM